MNNPSFGFQDIIEWYTNWGHLVTASDIEENLPDLYEKISWDTHDAAWEAGHDHGYDEGYAEGYHSGYAKGFKDGLEEKDN